MIKIIWNLRVKHEYYKVFPEKGLSLILSDESQRLLLRRGMIWRYDGGGRWLLFSLDGGHGQPAGEDRVVIDFRVEDKSLSYVTDWDWNLAGACEQLELSESRESIRMNTLHGSLVPVRPGVCFRLVFLFDKIGEKPLPYETELVFNSFNRQVEYLFLPRDENTERKLMIEDMENTIVFDDPVEIDFMGKKVIRFRSKEKVKMKEFPDYRLRLWEIYPSGKREICRQLPYPDPGNIIGDTYKDILCRLLYI